MDQSVPPLVTRTLLICRSSGRYLVAGVGKWGTTTRETPWAGEVGVTVLCAPSPSYACIDDGYSTWTADPSGWAWSEYGDGIASENSYGPHNCTLYVAYRLQQAGLAYPGWHDNADNWATDAAAAGTLVNQTPAVGAVAQWNNPSTGGHVAIVEQVTSTSLWSRPITTRCRRQPTCRVDIPTVTRFH